MLVALLVGCSPNPLPHDTGGPPDTGGGGAPSAPPLRAATEAALRGRCTGIDFFPVEEVHLGAAGGEVLFQFEGCATGVRASCSSWIGVELDERLREGSRATVRQFEAVEVPAAGTCLFVSHQNQVELPVYLP